MRTRRWRRRACGFVSGGQDLAACWRVGISYSDHYEDQGLFQRLMDRAAIAPGGDGFLRCETVLS